MKKLKVLSKKKIFKIDKHCIENNSKGKIKMYTRVCIMIDYNSLNKNRNKNSKDAK